MKRAHRDIRDRLHAWVAAFAAALGPLALWIAQEGVDAAEMDEGQPELVACLPECVLHVRGFHIDHPVNVTTCCLTL